MTFADLGLSDELLRAVSESGYDTPTPIQRQAIPSVLMGRDIIGIAQTGTGKTAGFVLPMIDILHQGRSRARMPRSMILEPTRELAAQVAENFVKYGKYHKLSMALLIGGGMVAENSKVWRDLGSFEQISSMSGMKPMSSIRSASSITSRLQPLSMILPRPNRSISRPGVAMSTSTPFSSALTWSPI